MVISQAKHGSQQGMDSLLVVMPTILLLGPDGTAILAQQIDMPSVIEHARCGPAWGLPDPGAILLCCPGSA